MSVIMTLVAKGDPQALERYAADNPDAMRAIADRAKEHGLIAHRFYGGDDGQLMVVDEWPDEDSFHSFFQAEQGRIQEIMGAAGGQSEPSIQFWRSLDTNDKVGWD